MGKAPFARGGTAACGTPASAGFAADLREEARMYRSVTESDYRESGRRRALRWVEGIGIGVLFAVILVVTFL